MQNCQSFNYVLNSLINTHPAGTLRSDLLIGPNRVETVTESHVFRASATPIIWNNLYKFVKVAE